MSLKVSRKRKRKDADSENDLPEVKKETEEQAKEDKIPRRKRQSNPKQISHTPDMTSVLPPLLPNLYPFWGYSPLEMMSYYSMLSMTMFPYMLFQQMPNLNGHVENMASQILSDEKGDDVKEDEEEIDVEMPKLEPQESID